MRALEGGVRAAFLVFFGSHIPITLMVDGQGLASVYYPQPLRDLVAWYSNLFGDVLMRYPSPNWFQGLILSELSFQVPFFVVALRIVLRTKAGEKYPRWFQTLCIIYGAHTSTTMVPILSTFLLSDTMSMTERLLTTSLYIPYLAFPLWILYLAAIDDFADLSSSSEKKEK